MKVPRIQIILLTLSISLLLLGFLEGEYELVRIFVRFLCSACIGLG